MKLFERINIGTPQLKNSVVLAPMGTTTDHTYGFNERDVAYYGERAKGDVGCELAVELCHQGIAPTTACTRPSSTRATTACRWATTSARARSSMPSARAITASACLSRGDV